MNKPVSQTAVALVGVNRESAGLLSALSDSAGLKVIKVLNPETEPLEDLCKLSGLSIVINATGDPGISSRIAALKLENVDNISALTAHILFGAGHDNETLWGSGIYRNGIVDSLEEIRRALHVSGNKEELLKLVLTIAIRSCGADTGSIMLIDPAQRCLRIEMAYGLDGQIVSSTAQKLGQGIAGKVVRTREPALINGTPQDESADTSSRCELISAICCPLVVGEEVIGVLNVNSKDPQRVFCVDDVRYLSKVTMFISDIIWTSREYSTSARDAFLFSFVSTIRAILHKDFLFEERLNLVLMKTANALGARVCRYYRFDPDSGAFFTVASSHVDLNLLRNRPVRLNDHLTSLVVSSPGRSVVCSGAGGAQPVHYVLVPVRGDSQVAELVVVQLVASSRNRPNEIAALEDIGALLEEQYRLRQDRETSRMRTIRYSALAELVFSLATVPGLKGLMQLAVSNVCLLMEARSAVMRVVEPGTGVLTSVEVFSTTRSHGEQQMRELDTAVSAEVSARRITLVETDLAHSRFALPAGLAISCCMSSYILSGTDTIGTLSVYDPSECDKDVFLQYVHQVAKGVCRFVNTRAAR